MKKKNYESEHLEALLALVEEDPLEPFLGAKPGNRVLSQPLMHVHAELGIHLDIMMLGRRLPEHLAGIRISALLLAEAIA